MEYLKSIFLKKFPSGALESPHDPRNVPASAVLQADGPLPDEYVTEMTDVRDQGNKPKCVGSAICEVGELYLAQKGINVSLDDDDLYALCKKQDGIPEIAGTYPSVGAKIAHNTGLLGKDGKRYKVGGYAFVSNNFEAIAQAIVQSKAIVGSVSIDNGWFLGKIGRVLQSLGRHLVVLHGFSKKSNLRLYGQNSWGTGWIGQIAGLIDPKVKPGHFVANYDDLKADLSDLIVFADIPFDVKDAYAKNWDFKHFKPNENGVPGLDLKFLKKLDEARGYAGIPFKITSGVRTKEQNAKVGGVSNSSHLAGLAADIAAATSAQKYNVVKGAIQADIPRIIVYAAHVHLDDDRTKPYPILATSGAD